MTSPAILNRDTQGLLTLVHAFARIVLCPKRILKTNARE
jgi:hypothetical protein